MLAPHEKRLIVNSTQMAKVDRKRHTKIKKTLKVDRHFFPFFQLTARLGFHNHGDVWLQIVKISEKAWWVQFGCLIGFFFPLSNAVSCPSWLHFLHSWDGLIQPFHLIYWNQLKNFIGRANKHVTFITCEQLPQHVKLLLRDDNVLRW